MKKPKKPQSTGRVFRCGTCGHEADLATLVPELQVKLGRTLSDSEYDTLHAGWWHTCVLDDDGEVAKSANAEERVQPRARMAYDWRKR